jgi:hypothetical protein
MGMRKRSGVERCGRSSLGVEIERGGYTQLFGDDTHAIINISIKE